MPATNAIAQSNPQEAAKQARPKTTYYYKLFRVKRKDGRVTTVSTDLLLLARACRSIPGGLASVSRLARESAFRYEDGMAKSCSAFVRQEIMKVIESQGQHSAQRQTQASQALATA